MLCVVGSINLAFSMPCLNENDFQPDTPISIGTSTVPCKSIPVSKSIDCTNNLETILAMSPCCGSGRIKCSEEFLIPCANSQDFMPTTTVKLDNLDKISTCVELMADAPTTEIDCSKLDHVKFLLGAQSCCGSGALQCERPLDETPYETPCKNDDDFAKEFQPYFGYPTCGTAWAMIEQTQTDKRCSNKIFANATLQVSVCCSGKAWKCHGDDWTPEPVSLTSPEAEESEETLQLVILMVVIFGITSIVMYIKLARSRKNPEIPSYEHKADKNLL